MSIDLNKIGFFKKKFGLRIKELRESKGFSQTDLASICDFEKSSISRIESGRTNVTLKTSLILSDALEVKIVDLYDNIDEV